MSVSRATVNVREVMPAELARAGRAASLAAKVDDRILSPGEAFTSDGRRLKSCRGHAGTCTHELRSGPI